MKLFGESRSSQHTAGRSESGKSDKVNDETMVFSSVKTEAMQKDIFNPQEAGNSVDAKKRRTLRRVFIILGSMILALLAVVIVYSIWEKPPEIKDDGPKVQVTPETEITPAPIETPTVTEPQETEEPKLTGRNPDCYTFLICAYDQIGANTDTMLVGKLDTKEGTLNIVSIPRDTLVSVSWGVKKVNTILAAEDNDPEMLKEKLSDILGFQVDCYAVVDIRAIEKLVDCIGGVYYDIPRNMDYDDPTQNLSIHFSAGYQWLSGADAVKVLRFRVGNDNSGYANGDLGRIATQQDFLMSIASQMLKLGNIPNLSAAIDIFEQYVDTDLNTNNLAFFAREFLLLNKDNITFATVPGEAISIRGGSYYEIELESWLPIINEKINPFYDEIREKNLNVMQYLGSDTAVTTMGEEYSSGSFFNFYSYTG